MSDERRQHARHAVFCELRGNVLLETPEGTGVAEIPAEGPIIGKVSNIGVGGLCLVADHMVDTSQPLRCEILMPQLPVGIPTLLQVRWVRKHDDSRTYSLGLQFLL